MLNNIYSVYDVKAEAYLQPFFMQTNGQAIRSFSGACQDANTMFARYPEDYTLFHLGSFDDATSVFKNNVAPVPLVKALDYVKSSGVPVQQNISDVLPSFDEGNSVADDC